MSKLDSDEPAIPTTLDSSDNLIMDKLIADVEKLKSSIEANSELRQVYSEKFSSINEKIGELRNMLIDREKDISKIELSATKAADLVAEVQPEALMIEVKKSDAKVEGVKDKLESFHELINTVMKEVKDLQRVVKTFRGIDSVKEMLDDAHKDLISYEKIKGRVESRADKVEESYEDFLKKIEQFDSVKESVTNMHNNLDQYNDDIKKLKKGLNDAATSKDVEKIEKSMQSSIDTFKDQLNNEGFKKSISDVKELVFSLENELGSIVTEVTHLNRKNKDVIDRVELMEKINKAHEQSNIEKQEVKDEYDNLNKRLMVLEDSKPEESQQIPVSDNSEIQKQIDSLKEENKTLMKTVINLMKQMNELAEKLKSKHNKM